MDKRWRLRMNFGGILAPSGLEVAAQERRDFTIQGTRCHRQISTPVRALLPVNNNPPATPLVVVNVPVTTLDSEGRTVVTSTTTHAMATVSIEVTFTSTNSRGETIVSTTTQPAVIRVTTDSAGRAATVTSALEFVPTFGQVLTKTDAGGRTLVTTYTPSGEGLSNMISGSYSTTTVTNASAVADPLVVAWESSDLSRFPQAYATSLAKKIGVNYRGGQSPSLSTGAKAGIGVGASVLGLLLISIIAYSILRRRRKNREAAPAALNTPDDGPGEMEDQDVDHATRRWYLDGRWRNEAEANNEPAELDSRGVKVVRGPPAELDGSHVRS